MLRLFGFILLIVLVVLGRTGDLRAALEDPRVSVVAAAASWSLKPA